MPSFLSNIGADYIEKMPREFSLSSRMLWVGNLYRKEHCLWCYVNRSKICTPSGIHTWNSKYLKAWYRNLRSWIKLLLVYYLNSIVISGWCMEAILGCNNGKLTDIFKNLKKLNNWSLRNKCPFWNDRIFRNLENVLTSERTEFWSDWPEMLLDDPR